MALLHKAQQVTFLLLLTNEISGVHMFCVPHFSGFLVETPVSHLKCTHHSTYIDVSIT